MGRVNSDATSSDTCFPHRVWTQREAAGGAIPTAALIVSEISSGCAAEDSSHCPGQELIEEASQCPAQQEQALASFLWGSQQEADRESSRVGLGAGLALVALYCLSGDVFELPGRGRALWDAMIWRTVC